jgi:ATP-dependent exoDNAse (exonuclease V) beta subunit
MLAWLAGQGVLPATRQAAAERAVGLLGGLVASRLGQWVLAPRPGALQEAALIDVDGIAADRGISVVDRSFVENGERWIIDYKTTPLDAAGRADSPAGEACRLQLAERHREQLVRYGRLLAGDGFPQRLAILFVDGPWLTELPCSGR